MMNWGFNICVMLDGTIKILETIPAKNGEVNARLLEQTFQDAEDARRWLPSYVLTRQIKSKGSFIKAADLLKQAGE